MPKESLQNIGYEIIIYKWKLVIDIKTSKKIAFAEMSIKNIQTKKPMHKNNFHLNMNV